MKRGVNEDTIHCQMGHRSELSPVGWHSSIKMLGGDSSRAASIICAKLFRGFGCTLVCMNTREALLSEAGFENVFRTQNWARRRKLFCR